MKTKLLKILLLVMLLSLGILPFLFGAKGSTELPYADKPVLKVNESATKAAPDIQTRNEKIISRHSDILTKDMVDMKKPIRSFSWAGNNPVIVKIRYEDGGLSTFKVYKK